jgi:hypothetical protein
MIGMKSINVRHGLVEQGAGGGFAVEQDECQADQGGVERDS